MKPRRRALLDAIRAKRGEWTTGRVVAEGLAPDRCTARRDLTALASCGRLTRHGLMNDRRYTYDTIPGGTR